MRLRRVLIGVGLVLLLGTLSAAQGPAERPAFEVASVKPSPAGVGVAHRLIQFRGGRYLAHYITVRTLIDAAFDVQARYQVTGAPLWLALDHFDIDAKAPDIPDSAQGLIPTPVLSMTRSLLEDRFRLTTHFEQRELRVYALTVIRQDGKLGPKLRQRTVPCMGPAPLPALQTFRGHDACGGQVLQGLLRSTGTPMKSFAKALATLVPDTDRVVVDHTGLGGTFDIDLAWNPGTPSNGDGNGAPSDSSSGPSFFTALRDQLGLKLEPAKAFIDVLVIDHIERPSED
jgi:uncharacterized protein (TIGR03435 family)